MTRYWRYQTIGWLSLLAFDFMGKYVANMMIPSLLAAVAALYTLGLLASHGMRTIYKKYCANLSIAKLIPLTFLLSLVGALLAASGLMLLLYVSGHQAFTGDKVSPVQIFNYNLFLMWLFLSIWMGLYLFVTRQRQVDSLNQQQKALKDNLEQSQLHGLLNQLNPHFMFNCINNIRALILEDKHKARDMLAHMADMLRYNLQDHSQALESLQKELEIAHAYMQLASIQLEDRLTYVVDVDENLNVSIPVPRMLIQLLLENAIKHGIGLRTEGGTVTLKISNTNEKLLIQVSNHGSLTPQSNSGIGLKNIRTRLAILYQSHANFSIQQENELVLAKLEIPMEKKD